MKTHYRLLSIGLVLMTVGGAVPAFGQGLGGLTRIIAAAEFAEELGEAEIYLVQNATDDDIQTFVLAGAEDSALERLLVFDPEGQLVVNARFRDGDRLGMDEIQMETPEPTGLDIQKAYAEGEYFFAAFTVANTIAVGAAELSYELLPPPVVTFPAAGATDVPVDGLVVTWLPVEGAAAVVFEIEAEEAESALTADLPADATEFAIPPAWLQPGTEYVVDVEAVSENGNYTVTDLRFTTSD